MTLNPNTRQFLMQTALNNIIMLQEEVRQAKSPYWRRRYLKLKRGYDEILQSLIDDKPLPGPSIFDKPLFGSLFEEPLVRRRKGFLTKLPKVMREMGYL